MITALLLVTVALLLVVSTFAAVAAMLVQQRDEARRERDQALAAHRTRGASRYRRRSTCVDACCSR